MIAFDLPAPLQTRVINALEADPRSVDLRAQAPHFYALGAKILELFEDDVIVGVLLKVSLVICQINDEVLCADAKADVRPTSGGDCRSCA